MQAAPHAAASVSKTQLKELMEAESYYKSSAVSLGVQKVETATESIEESENIVLKPDKLAGSHSFREEEELLSSKIKPKTLLSKSSKAVSQERKNSKPRNPDLNKKRGSSLKQQSRMRFNVTRQSSNESSKKTTQLSKETGQDSLLTHFKELQRKQK